MIIVNNTFRLLRDRHPGPLQVCSPHRTAQLTESAPLHPLLQLELSVDLLHRQKHLSWALVNNQGPISRLVMPRLASRVQARLLASSRRVPLRRCGLGSIPDSKPINSHSKSPNDRGLPLSNRAPSLMVRPLYIRVQMLLVMDSRLRNIQDSTTAPHHKPNSLQFVQSSNSHQGSRPMRWSRTWTGCVSPLLRLLPTRVSLGLVRRMGIRMKSGVAPLREQLPVHIQQQ